MKYTFEKLNPPPPATKQLIADDMGVGDLAEVIDGPYQGGVLLRHYSGWVMLDQPDTTWTDRAHAIGGCCQLPIRPLTAGETVVLKVTE